MQKNLNIHGSQMAQRLKTLSKIIYEKVFNKSYLSSNEMSVEVSDILLRVFYKDSVI